MPLFGMPAEGSGAGRGLGVFAELRIGGVVTWAWNTAIAVHRTTFGLYPDAARLMHTAMR